MIVEADKVMTWPEIVLVLAEIVFVEPGKVVIWPDKVTVRAGTVTVDPGMMLVSAGRVRVDMLEIVLPGKVSVDPPRTMVCMRVCVVRNVLPA